MAQDYGAVLDKVYDALNRHDPAAVAALAGDDVAVEVIPWNVSATGRTAVEENYRAYFHAFPDVHYTSRNRVRQGDVVVDEWLMRGTLKGELSVGKIVIQPTNQPFELRGVNIFEFNGGRVSRLRVYFDALTLARQLGLVQLMQARGAGH